MPPVSGQSDRRSKQRETEKGSVSQIGTTANLGRKVKAVVQVSHCAPTLKRGPESSLSSFRTAEPAAFFKGRGGKLSAQMQFLRAEKNGGCYPECRVQ